MYSSCYYSIYSSFLSISTRERNITLLYHWPLNMVRCNGSNCSILGCWDFESWWSQFFNLFNFLCLNKIADFVAKTNWKEFLMEFVIIITINQYYFSNIQHREMFISDMEMQPYTLLWYVQCYRIFIFINDHLYFFDRKTYSPIILALT